MAEAVIVDALRTPMGRYGGALAPVRPTIWARTRSARWSSAPASIPATIDDVFWGAANQAGEDCRNVGRMATLLAGLPTSVPGTTLNRLCGSGLQALNSAFHAIAAGVIDVAIAGGAESMTRAPFVILKSEKAYDRAPDIHDTTLGNRMVNPRLAAMYPPISLGETAEKVAEQFGVTRDDQDRFAYDSQMKCKAAVAAGRFDAELVPVHVEQGKKSYDVDAGRAAAPRHDARVAGEAQARVQGQRHRHGRQRVAAQRRRGRAADLQRRGRGEARLAAARARRNVGDVRRRSERHGHRPDRRDAQGARAREAARRDLDLVELNEAFAAQSVACVNELGIDPAIVNVNGGAIALGHPLGCSGARIATTLLHELKRRGGRYGLATMCIGMGQGIATIFERV